MNWLENIYKKYLKVSLFLNTEKIPKSRLHIHAFDLEEIANNSSNSSISLTNQSKSYFFFCYQLVQFSSIEKFFLLKVALLTWFQCYVLKVILKLKSKTDLMFWLFITIRLLLDFCQVLLDLFYKEKRFLCILYSTNFKIIYKRITEFS